MLKNSKKCNFWKEHQKRLQKMGWMPKFDKLFRKLCPNENFGSLTSIFGVNFTQNLRNIELSQAKRLSYLLELFCWHILGGFKKNPRNRFFSKAQKLPKVAKNGFRQNGPKSQKSGRATFLTFFTPNFMPGFEKILGAVSEIIRDTTRTPDTRTILIL